MRKQAKKILFKHCPELKPYLAGDSMEQLKAKHRNKLIIDAMIEFRDFKRIKNNRAL